MQGNFIINGKVRSIVSAIGMAASVGYTSPAAAQAQSAAAPQQLAAAEDKSTGALPEIVVTATKREENLQKTSIAITAISGQMITDRGIATAADLGSTVPNLLASYASSYSPNAVSFTIRGIGQVDFITTTEPGVGVYLDGVYLARTTGSAVELADIERIEVLRGPQGTLFGRNATGGAVSIVTVKPSFDGVSGEASFSPSTYTPGWRPSAKAHFSLNAPLTDKIAIRVNVLGKLSEGWGKNNAPGRGEGLGKQAEIAGRLALLYNASDDWNVFLTADGSRGRGTIAPMIGIVGPAATPEDPLKTALSAPTYDDMDVYGFAGTVNGKLGDNVNVRSITAFRHQSGRIGQDSDGSVLPLIDQGVSYRQQQFSQELQLFGDLFNYRIKYLLGGYYFDEKGTFLTKGTIVYTPTDIETYSSTKSYAAFGNLTLKVLDGFNLVGGFRYTHEKKLLNAETRFAGAVAVPAGDHFASFSRPSFKAGFEYFPAPQFMIYGTFAQGLRSGGFNGRPFSVADLTPYGDETNNSYEVGFKAELFDRKVRFNAAAFYSKYNDIQLTGLAPGAVGLVIVTANAGVATLPGAEAELQWAASERLNIYGSVGYLHTNGLKPKPGFVFQGDTLPLATHVTSQIGLNYSVPLGTYNGKFGLDWNYRSRYFVEPDDSRLSQQTGFSLFNARLMISPVAKNSWDFTLFAKNLTNKQYRAFGSDSTGFVGTVVVSPGQPREIGGTFRIRF